MYVRACVRARVTVGLNDAENPSADWCQESVANRAPFSTEAANQGPETKKMSFYPWICRQAAHRAAAGGAAAAANDAFTGQSK